MKYVLTGGAGHITKPLALQLLQAGHTVTIIGRNEANLAELTAAGATAAIGTVEDIAFLTGVFSGADAVYTMVPPKWDAADWKSYIGQIGKNYAEAIKATGVKYVVNLSSIGAHLDDGCGPVSGLYRAEVALNTLEDVNIKHLRPAFFYQNLLSNVNLIKQAGIMGGNYGAPGSTFVIVDPSDIAAAAGEELLTLNFTGHAVRYIASDEITPATIASTIGEAIGKPGLPWVEFTDEQSYQGMIGAGLSEEVAKNYVEMGAALRTGAMTEDYWKNHPVALGNVKIADFAKVFAIVYNSNAQGTH
ncbi:MAG TPA: NAD(P)H-binding protein [Chitinophagaceae bacterium]|nr:NAD(P)H-binding protein [Chitinophagaceae bacterium]